MNGVIRTGQALLVDELGNRDVPVAVTRLLALLKSSLFLLRPRAGEGVFVWILGKRRDASGEDGLP